MIWKKWKKERNLKKISKEKLLGCKAKQLKKNHHGAHVRWIIHWFCICSKRRATIKRKEIIKQFEQMRKIIRTGERKKEIKKKKCWELWRKRLIALTLLMDYLIYRTYHTSDKKLMLRHFRFLSNMKLIYHYAWFVRVDTSWQRYFRFGFFHNG